MQGVQDDHTGTNGKADPFSNAQYQMLHMCFEFWECDLEPFRVFMGMRTEVRSNFFHALEAVVTDFFPIRMYQPIVIPDEYMIILMFRKSIIKIRTICELESRSDARDKTEFFAKPSSGGFVHDF
jgi:hypothetical protein